MPASGGEAVKLTSGKNAVQQFKWSRDGKKIAFLAPDPRTDDEEKKHRDGEDEKVIDADTKPVRIWTVDVSTKAVKRETGGAYAVREFEWIKMENSFLPSPRITPHSICPILSASIGFRATMENSRNCMHPRRPFVDSRYRPMAPPSLS